MNLLAKAAPPWLLVWSALLLPLECPRAVAATFSDTNWISMGGFWGVSSTASATAVDAAGNLYVGTGFTVVGSVVASGVAKWDGTNWSALGSGMGTSGSGLVFALAVSGNNLFAGGSFTNAGGLPAANIARWDGTNWHPIGAGLNGVVRSLVVLGGSLYLGGEFTIATNIGGGTVAVNRVARWDGSAFSALGQGVDATVWALTAEGGSVYAGGEFINATNSGGGPVPVHRIARWDGANWSTLGGGVGGPDSFRAVYALAATGGSVVAGGNFLAATNTGGASVAANYLARWDGANWSAVGAGANNYVFALATSGSDLYVGGGFTAVTNTGGGAASASRIARWDGANWSALQLGFNNAVRALAAAGTNVYAGGDFTAATNAGIGSIAASRVAQWTGTRWTALGNGVNGGLRAMAMVGNELLVGGSFTEAVSGPGGTVRANRVARWNGQTWSGLGFGLNNTVNAIVVREDNRVFVGGTFTTATNTGGGVIIAPRLARWVNGAWASVGWGVNQLVEALAISGTNLYVGGLFTAATNIGGATVPASRVALWNSVSWSALGGGLNGTVNALAADGDTVYAGGLFTEATNTGGGAVTVNRVARWDGTNWSALGAGFAGSVGALKIKDSNLYASHAPGVVERWDGAIWTPLGLGFGGGSVTELAFAGNDLIAVGSFTNVTNTVAGAVPANRAARWDGANWSALGGGFNATVWAAEVVGENLFVGGDFSFVGGTTTGGKYSLYLARAWLGDLPPALTVTDTDETAGQFHFTLTGPAGSNVVIQTSTNLPMWEPLATNSLGVGWLQFTDPQSSNETRRFYRGVLP